MHELRLDGITVKSRRALELAARDGDDCIYCQRALHDRIRTIDHIVPLSHGGRNTLNNLALACLYCNTMRGSADHGLFLTWRRDHLDANRITWLRYLYHARRSDGPQGELAARSSSWGEVPREAVGSCDVCQIRWKILAESAPIHGDALQRWVSGCTCGAPPNICVACAVYYRSCVVAGVPTTKRPGRAPLGCTCDD